MYFLVLFIFAVSMLTIVIRRYRRFKERSILSDHLPGVMKQGADGNNGGGYSDYVDDPDDEGDFVDEDDEAVMDSADLDDVELI